MSMRNLNFSNVEELIFQDEEAQRVLPQFFSYFESWRLGKRLPMLRQLSKAAVLDFLSNLQEIHVHALEEYFDERLIVERLSYDIVTNLKVPLSETDACGKLCDVVGFRNFAMWRDDQHLYITAWR